MGDQRVSTKTLPTGEKVLDYPDGRQVLQPTNALSGFLEGRTDEHEVASAALTEALVQSATEKREAQASGDAVPPDKSVV